MEKITGKEEAVAAHNSKPTATMLPSH